MECGDYRYGTEAEVREHLIEAHGYTAEVLAGYRSMAQIHVAEMEAGT